MKRNRKGFTLIELLIVVAIIGIIVAIAIPNLLNAIQRAKQKRTMGDMRSIGTAAEAYAVDNNQYPAAAATLPSGLGYPTAAMSTTVIGQLSPTYIRIVPTQDGWNETIKYTTGNSNQDYILVSFGKDTTTGPDVAGYGPTTSFNNDIIFVDGQFIQYAEGQQK